MSEERWEQLKRLCEEARELAPGERSTWLNEACAGDADLRRELESLLAYSSQAEAFIEQPAFKLFAHEVGPAPPLTGWQFGHYRIEALLGVGGMGEVYKAQDTKLGRAVAIKFLPGEFTSDAERVRRFEQEAYAASSLNHPYIVTVYEIGQVEVEHGARHYIAYELVEGQTLRRLLEQTKLAWPEAVRLAIQLAEALKAAHEAGIIHRDIKPENVMLRPDGRVKVLDFGIAKRFHALSADEVGNGQRSGAANAGNTTLTGGLLGTPKYFSPEQARLERVDAGTDIFALGLMLYEMLAGRHPFAERNSEEIMAELLSDGELPALSNRAKDIPVALEAVVSKALKKARAERYSSIGQMLDALNEFKPALESRAAGKLRGMQALVKTQNANRLLNQFVSLYAVDERTRLSPLALWTIWRHSDIRRGRLETALLRRSLASACWKSGRVAVLAGLLTLALAAPFSIAEKWDERVLRDGHTAGVRRAAFSPDGKWLVSVGEDRQVLVWDFARRELKRRLTDHTGWVVAVAFAPDGNYFATASWDQTVIVWDAESLEKVAVLREQRGPITGVAFAPDGKYLAAASNKDKPDARTVLWDARRWTKVRELPLRGGEWWPLLFSPTNPKLLRDGDKASDVETGREINLSVKAGGSGEAFSPDGSQLVVVDSAGRVTFVDFARQKLLANPIIHRDHGRAAAFSPDGKLAATGSEDIALWNAMTHELITRWDHTSYVWGLAFAPDGRYLVSTHGDGSLLLWDMIGRERVANLNQHSHPIAAVASSLDGRRIVSGGEDRSVIIWNAVSGHKEAVLLGHRSRITGVALSPDGQWAASLDQDGELICWDIAARQPRWCRNKLGNKRLTISPDGRWVAIGSGVYDSSTGELVFTYDCDPQGWCNYTDISFSGDGRRLAVVGDSRVYVCETPKWRSLGQTRTERDELTVSLSSDGTQFVTGNVAGEITLWQTEPLRPVGVIGRHAARVKQVAFSPDNRHVASVGDDNKLKLWEVGARKLVQEIGAHTAPVLAVAFSRDGRQIITGEHDKSVRVYTRQRTLWGWRLD